MAVLIATSAGGTPNLALHSDYRAAVYEMQEKFQQAHPGIEIKDSQLLAKRDEKTALRDTKVKPACPKCGISDASSRKIDRLKAENRDLRGTIELLDNPVIRRARRYEGQAEPALFKEPCSPTN